MPRILIVLRRVKESTITRVPLSRQALFSLGNLSAMPDSGVIAASCTHGNYLMRLRVQPFVMSGLTGSGLLLRSTRESEIKILPSRTTVCSTNPYLAAILSFLRTPRDTTANCSTSASSTGLPKFHVKL